MRATARLVMTIALGVAAACGSAGGPPAGTIAGAPDLPALAPVVRCPDPAACEAACDHDDARACEDLGNRLASGAGVELAPTRAAALFERACAHGRATACVGLGLLFQDGRGVGESDERAAMLYDQACKTGAGVGCFDLALMVDGGPLAYDRARVVELAQAALPLYAKACDGGDLEVCINLGVLYEGGLLGAPDLPRAADIYRRACWGGAQGGSANACVNLALMLLEKPASAPFAARLLDHACGAGSAIACGVLGQTYYSGKGVAADPQRALPLLDKGCNAGDAPACGALGAILSLGDKGVTPDPARSRAAEDRGCAMGEATACMALAGDAMETQHDVDGAGRAFERACAIGNGEGCWTLATLRQEGKLPGGRDGANAAATSACRLHYDAACIVLLAQGVDAPVPADRIPELRAQGCKAGLATLCDKTP